MLRERLAEIAEMWAALGAPRRGGFFAQAGGLLTSDTLGCKDKVQNRFKQWLHWPFLFVRLPQSDMTRLIDEYSEAISNAETLGEVVDVFRRYSDDLIRLTQRTGKLSMEVQKVIKFIETHYAENISLQDAANYVNMSPNYVSSLCKKELGSSFIDYLIHYRVERAKELLLETHQKVYEIAEKVGLENQSYFSRIFKRETGLTPREFRRKFHGDLAEEFEDAECV